MLQLIADLMWIVYDTAHDSVVARIAIMFCMGPIWILCACILWWECSISFTMALTLAVALALLFVLCWLALKLFVKVLFLLLLYWYR